MIIGALLSVMIYVPNSLKVNTIALPLFRCANSAQNPISPSIWIQSTNNFKTVSLPFQSPDG